MTAKKTPKGVDTGGGAYFGGDVEAGGDVVGRDQVKTVDQHREGATVEELARLLAEVRGLLPEAGLDPDVAEAIEGDFRVVEAQAAKEAPKAGLIRTKLRGISEMIQESGKNADAVQKILTLLGSGAAMVGALF